MRLREGPSAVRAGGGVLGSGDQQRSPWPPRPVWSANAPKPKADAPTPKTSSSRPVAWSTSCPVARVILYHRHVGPVLVRHWSVRMDLFTATVAASVDTRKFRTIS